MIYQLDEQKPDCHSSSWVAENATVVGNVILDAESSIWFGATLRGDNEVIKIGQGSNVQENCALHTDPGFKLIIGSNCTIGHGAIIHGCKIDDGSLIGMGAIILNGAKIGKGCLIGAGALVTEGKIIPDGSMVLGSPGKIVKELDPAAQKRLLQSAETYKRNAVRFSSGLHKI